MDRLSTLLATLPDGHWFYLWGDPGGEWPGGEWVAALLLEDTPVNTASGATPEEAVERMLCAARPHLEVRSELLAVLRGKES
jgi:hypothetical protein